MTSSSSTTSFLQLSDFLVSRRENQHRQKQQQQQPQQKPKKSAEETETEEALPSLSSQLTFADRLDLHELQRESRKWKRFTMVMERRHEQKVEQGEEELRQQQQQLDGDDDDEEGDSDSDRNNRDSHLPHERKIYRTPLKRYRSEFIAQSQRERVAIDPRFVGRKKGSGGAADGGGGWELRNAYRFLDVMIERDIRVTSKQMKDSKRKLKRIAGEGTGAEDQWIGKNRRMRKRERRKRWMRMGMWQAKVRVAREEMARLKGWRSAVRERESRQREKADRRREDINRLWEGKQQRPFYLKRKMMMKMEKEKKKGKKGNNKWKKKKRI